MFKHITIGSTIAPWCVDGRPDYSAPKGPQMLGGSLHLVALQMLYENRTLDSIFVTETLTKLKEAGYTLGVHRGAHKDPSGNKSDCGFSDRMIDILAKAIDQKDEIITRLLGVNDEHKEIFGTEATVSQLLEHAYERLSSFNISQIELDGDALVRTAQGLGAHVVNLAGDHAEHVAFVNNKMGTTLDTNGFNKSNTQAFNLDLWAVREQAKVLGIDEGFTTAMSLILYQATEMVLVEDKGKPQLPIIINS